MGVPGKNICLPLPNSLFRTMVLPLDQHEGNYLVPENLLFLIKNLNSVFDHSQVLLQLLWLYQYYLGRVGQTLLQHRNMKNAMHTVDVDLGCWEWRCRRFHDVDSLMWSPLINGQTRHLGRCRWCGYSAHWIDGRMSSSGFLVLHERIPFLQNK